LFEAWAEGEAMTPTDKMLEALSEVPLVPLFSTGDVPRALALCEILHQAGFTALELTHRNPQALEVFKAVHKWNAAQAKPLLLGAGSVTDSKTALDYALAGASFVVGPGFVPEVAKTCQETGHSYIPGCMTPTEVLAAHAQRCEIIKLFPASSLGPSFLKALRGPCPWLRALPTGGIKPMESDLRAWFDAGAFALGLGSEFIPKAELESGDFGALAGRAAEVLVLAKRLRNE
jgi:2-dehydro-3-deoxyphosphogluconate aldolase/(4S)-4-hydroxy-2-oxoglutarate aldolase